MAVSPDIYRPSRPEPLIPERERIRQARELNRYIEKALSATPELIEAAEVAREHAVRTPFDFYRQNIITGLGDVVVERNSHVKFFTMGEGELQINHFNPNEPIYRYSISGKAPDELDIYSQAKKFAQRVRQALVNS